MRSLAAIMRQADAPPSARIQAIGVLMDRGWGKAVQPHVGDNANDTIQVVIREIFDVVQCDTEEPPLLELETLEK